MSSFPSTLRWAAMLVALGVLSSIAACASRQAAHTPAPVLDSPKTAGVTQTIVLAGGCFWGVEAVFEHLKGVKRVVSGYAGGDQATASYSRVSSGSTRHAEAVQVTFDPGEVSVGEILQVFFSAAHDPTQLNRQGPDHGPQYRSAIFYSDDTQMKIARAYIAQVDSAQLFRSAIVTRVEPLEEFYPAEDYHQDYWLKHPSAPYIVIHDLPKIRHFQRVLPALYRGQPATQIVTQTAQ